MTRLLAGLCALALLGACAPNVGSDSPPEAVAAAAFRADDPPSLTVFTMVNNRTGNGGHTSLMVNGSQRVIFDPAGSFRHPQVVERQDVLYGITPGKLRSYKSAHARSTFHVVSQEIPVTAAQAEEALRLVQANGSVAGAFCTNATTGVMRQIPGFQQIDQTYYPVMLMEQVSRLPGVTTTKLYENDDGDVIDAVQAAEFFQ